ncbi:heavy-metal-associated domain-containing protein [Thermodesulfobacteriota bacterium]
MEIKFLVEDITCAGCAMDMENILLELNGVDEASLNYAAGEFIIQYDPGVVEEKTITKKVENLGFKTKLIKEQN